MHRHTALLTALIISVLAALALASPTTPIKANQQPDFSVALLKDASLDLDCRKSGPGTTPKVATLKLEDGSQIQVVHGLDLDPVMQGENIPCSDPLWSSSQEPVHDVLLFNSSDTDIAIRLGVLPKHRSEGDFGGYGVILPAHGSLKIVGVASDRYVHVAVYLVDADPGEGAMAIIDYDCDKLLRRINEDNWQPYELYNGLTAIKFGFTEK